MLVVVVLVPQPVILRWLEFDDCCFEYFLQLVQFLLVRPQCFVDFDLHHLSRQGLEL